MEQPSDGCDRSGGVEMLKIIPVEIPELAPLTTVATDLAVLNQPLDEYLPRALAALTGEITWRADFIPSPELIDRLAVVENFVVIGAFEYEGKPQLLMMYSHDLVEKGHNASKDIKEASKAILGGGGGQPGLATAGGKNTAGLPEALETLVSLATKKE